MLAIKEDRLTMQFALFVWQNVEFLPLHVLMITAMSDIEKRCAAQVIASVYVGDMKSKAM